MNHKQFTTIIKPSSNKEEYKKAFVHLVALHTGNTPSAIETSLRNKDGFAKQKINSLKPNVLSEIYKSSITHGNLKGGK